MAIADLFNVPLTPEQMAAWSFAHMAHHRDVIAQALKQKNVALPEYILDPIREDDMDAFLNQHQDMHNNVDALYGIGGFDLSDVNWSDQQARAGWIFLNATLHVLEANATGAG